MSNQNANVDGNPCEEVSGSGYPQTHTYRVTATDTIGNINLYPTTTNGTHYVPNTSTSSPTFTYTYPSLTFNGPQIYTMYWGDERREIPHHCRCGSMMGQPDENHVYIKKMWFCSIKCYQEHLVACIGENIDEAD